MTPPRYLGPRTRPLVPAAKALRDTLRQDVALSDLTRRARDGQSRLETLKPAIPKSLHSALQAGGVDDEGWTLLVRNAAAAAKLRMLQPHLALLLREQFGPGELRIKLMTPL